MRALGNHARWSPISRAIRRRMWNIPFLGWAMVFALMLALTTFGFRRL